jgi:hypothetical protein
VLTVVVSSAACSDDGGTVSETGEPCEEAPPPQSLPELEGGFALTDDVDADGHVDIVMLSAGEGELPTPIVHWGSTDGDFTESQELPFTSLGDLRAGSVSLADLDGDGDLDVLRVSWDAELAPAEAQASIEVAMQTAPRSFEPPVSTDPAGLGRVQIVAADLDGDGNDELAGIINLPETSLLSIPSDGPVLEALVPGVTTAWLYGRQLTVADLDGDAREEIVAFGRPPDGDTSTPTVLIASADADLALVEVGEYTAGTDPGSLNGNLALGDFDGDEYLDICVVNLRNLSVFRGLEGVAFAEGQLLDFPEFAAASGCESCNSIYETRAGDFDGDGVDELAVSSSMDEAWLVDEVLGQTPTLVPLEQWGRNVADFDADGCDDILAVDSFTDGPLGTSFEWTLVRCPLRSCG